MLLKDLQQFGLSKNISTVYLALFELGSAKAGELIRKTGLHRNLVYTALDQLEEKKLIAKSTSRGVALYKALEASQLLGELKTQRVLAESIIEQMQSMKNTHKQEVIVYEGIEEMQRKEIEAYSSMKKGETLRFLGISANWHTYMGKSHNEKTIAIQKENQFFIQVLSAEIDPQSAAYFNKIGEYGSWKISNKIASGEVETLILSDRIHIRSFVEPFTTIEIINPELVQSYTKQFESLWNQQIKSFSGWDEIEKLYFTELLPKPGQNTEAFCIGGGYGEITNHNTVEEFYIRFHTERIKIGGHYQILFYEQHADRAYKEFAKAGDPELQQTDLKFLPNSYYSPLQIFMTQNKVAVVHFGNKPQATLYDDPEIYNSFKKQFDLLWNQPVQSYSGWKQIETLFLERVLNNLDANQTEYVLGANYPTEKYAKKHQELFLKYNTALGKKRAKKHLLFYEADRSAAQEEKIQSGVDFRQHSQLRFLPESHRSPMEIHILPNLVVVCTWGETPIATVYKTKEIIDGFAKQFDLLWKQARS